MKFMMLSCRMDVRLFAAGISVRRDLDKIIRLISYSSVLGLTTARGCWIEGYDTVIYTF